MLLASIERFIILSRPYNALLPLAAIATGFLVATGGTGWQLAIAMICFVLLHGVVTIWNDFEDEAGDKLNGINRVGTVRRAGDYRRYKLWGAILVAIALLLGMVLPRHCEAVLISYVVLGWAYNAHPFQLSHRPIGSMVCMFLAYGLFPFALGAFLGVWRSPEVVVLGLGWSLSRLSLSLLKDYKDAPGDAKAAKKTFLLVYGNRVTSRVSIGLFAIGLGAIVAVLSIIRSGWLVRLFGAVAAWLLWERLQLLAREDYRGLHAVFREGLRYQLMFDAAVVVWLATS